MAILEFDIGSVSDAIDISIDGPLSSYKFSYSSKFISDTEIKISLVLSSQIIGSKSEKAQIHLTPEYFVSSNNIEVSNKNVDTYIYQKQSYSEALKQGGTATTSLLGITMGTIILSNVLL
jgi:hypothetical protein